MPPKKPSFWVTPHWVPPSPDGEPSYKRKRDGWLPFLAVPVSRYYRKRRRLVIDLLRTGYAEHSVREPLRADWEGFPGQLAESIKVLYTVEFQKRGLPHGHILVWLKRLDTEMPISPLSDLNPFSRDWTVHVYVSRLWQHRGATDDGPIKHTDMVFLDAQGNHMYGEISSLLVPDFIERIREGKVYELRRFLVFAKKNYFRPVEADFMIRFSRYTAVRELSGNVMDYPLYTYALTPIDDLPAPVDLPASFTDVVGIITGVSPTTQYHSASRSTPSTKRIVYLSDLSGFEINVVLWGERATAFDGDGVLRTAQDGPVVALFVGTLVKPFEGRRSLSGGAPCRWYINEDLPEVNELLDRLKDKVPAVQSITLQGQTAAEITAQVELETKTLAELAALDIYDTRRLSSIALLSSPSSALENVGGSMRVIPMVREQSLTELPIGVRTKTVEALVEHLGTGLAILVLMGPQRLNLCSLRRPGRSSSANLS